MSNKKYETNKSEVKEVTLPGGSNIRISYSKGITIGMPNYGSERFDTSYACDVPKEEAEEMSKKIKSFIDAEVKRAAQTMRKEPS